MKIEIIILVLLAISNIGSTYEVPKKHAKYISDEKQKFVRSRGQNLLLE